MSKKIEKALIGATLGMGMSALALTGIAQAAENPFAVKGLERGYMVAEAGKAADKATEADKAGDAKMKDGKCGEGKCGASAAGGAKAADDKAKDAKCGEAKCGGAKKQ